MTDPLIESSIVKMSPEIGDLATALSKAQGEFENPTKDTNNPFFKSKYADLASIINAIKPIMSKNGLSISQHPSFKANLVSVQTILMHNSGQWMSSVISAPVSKLDPQGVGSATSYCRRYALSAIVCIAQEDDDGNLASGHKKHESNDKFVHLKPAAVDDDIPDWWIPQKMVEKSNALKAFAGTQIKQISLDDLHKIADIAKGLLMEATTDNGRKMSESVHKMCMEEIMLRPESAA